MRKLYRALCLYLSVRMTERYELGVDANQVIAEAAKMEVFVVGGITEFRERFTQAGK